MANKENVIALAELIEAQPHVGRQTGKGFNLADWTHPCGTPSCIWGFAESMRTGQDEVDEEAVISDTCEWLGILLHDGESLFAPNPAAINWRHYGTITPAEAGKVLRYLAETGRVDWSIIND